MFCTHCGHEVGDGAKFCTHCGARLAPLGESEGSSESATVGLSQPASESMPDGLSESAPEGEDPVAPSSSDEAAADASPGEPSEPSGGAKEPSESDADADVEASGSDAPGGGGTGVEASGSDAPGGSGAGDASDADDAVDVADKTNLLDTGETTLLGTGETVLLGNGETTRLGDDKTTLLDGGETSLLDTGETSLLGSGDATGVVSAAGETATVPATPKTAELPRRETEAFPAEDEGEPATDGLDVLPEAPAPQATKFCVNCGATVPAGARFCTNCGQLADVPADAQDAAQAFPAAVASPAGPAQQGPDASASGQVAPGNHDRPSSGGHVSTGLVVLVTALVTLVVACGIVAGLHYVGALGNPQALSFLPMREQPAAAPATTAPAAQTTAAAPASTAAAPAATTSATQNVTLKDYKGQDEQTARDGIAAAGLTVGTVTAQSSNSVEKGRVISQSVTGSVKRGTAVDLVVSSGAAAAATPAQRQYTVVDQAMTWEQAKAYCEQNGGHLAVVQTEDDWNRVLALMKADGRKVFWLGASRVNGSFQWVDGSAISYSAFASGEPNNETGDENYLAVFNSNDNWGWYDVPNDLSSFYKPERMAFVMEKD